MWHTKKYLSLEGILKRLNVDGTRKSTPCHFSRQPAEKIDTVSISESRLQGALREELNEFPNLL